MKTFKNQIYIKIISLAISVLMTWQSIAWSDPDIFLKQDLQPESMFDVANRNSGLAVSLAGYILGVLSRMEAVDGNKNLYSMKTAADKELKALKDSGKVPADIESMIPDATEGAPESGAFVIDLGDCIVRYYNQRIPGAGEPGEDLRVMEDVKVGEYISRQVLVRRKLADGLVAKGDEELLYKTFMSGAYVTGGLRESLKLRIPALVSRMKAVIKTSDLKDDTKAVLEGAVGKLEAAEFVEFKPLVITDVKDPTMPSAWMLGFSTLKNDENDAMDPAPGLGSMLGGSFPNTIGVSGRLLDIIATDELIFLEYLFHEAVCSRLGHQKARELQEHLFPENYSRVFGDARPGHKDGELALILKQVIWEACAQPSAKEIDGQAINEDFEKFQNENFTKDGPQQATKYYVRYKKWYEWVRRFMLISLSRLRESDYAQATALIISMDNRYNYIVAKLTWVWNMEALWAKAETVMGTKKFGELDHDSREKVISIALELLRAHEDFMQKNPWAEHLEGDVSVEEALMPIRIMAGERVIPVEFMDEPVQPVEVFTFKTSDTPEKDIQQPKEGKGTTDNRPETETLKREEKDDRAAAKKVTLSRIDWKGMAFTFIASLGLSAVLYFILPVNIFTTTAAFVLTAGVFIYFLSKAWSWKNFFVAVAISAAFSFLLPVPWLGVSLAIVIVSRMLAQGSSGAEAKMGGRSMPAGKDAKKLPKEKTGKEPGDGKKEDITKKGKEEEAKKPNAEAGADDSVLLSKVTLKRDVFLSFARLLKARNPEKPATASSSAELQEINNRTVLESVFRLSALSDIVVNKNLKETMRPLVRKEILRLQRSMDFSIRRHIEKLTHWSEYDDDTLVESLQDVCQEVAASLTSWSFGEDSKDEMVVIHELVGEHFRIEKKKLSEILMKLFRGVLLDQVRSDEIIGRIDAERYYLLGRIEFHFGSDMEAENFFKKAAAHSPTNPDYLLSLGVLRHFMKSWDPAVQSYRFSLGIIKNKPQKTEADLAAMDLLEHFIPKAGSKISLERDNVGRQGREGVAPAVIPFLRGSFERIFNHGREVRIDKYAVNVAPWWEEGIFYALPLVIGHWLFGLGSFGVIPFIAGFRVGFYFFHPAARTHAPPAEYITPLIVALAGSVISFLPVLAVIPAFAAYRLHLMIFSVFFSVCAHCIANVVAIAVGVSPAAIRSRDDVNAEGVGNMPLSEIPFYKAWQKVIVGERPGIDQAEGYTKDYLESIPEGRDFLQNNSKIIHSIRYLFDEMSEEDRRTAMKHISAVAGIIRLAEWKLSDFEKLHALRAMGRSLLVAISVRHDVPDNLKGMIRGMVYGISLLALYTENSICAARLKRNVGLPFKMPQRYLVEDPESSPEGLRKEDYEAVLAGMQPYYHVFDRKVRESLDGKDLYKMPVVGSLMEAYTGRGLPFVVKVIKEGGKNSFGDAGDFERDVLRPVMIARRKLGGLAANALPMGNLQVSVEGRQVMFDKAIIQREVIPLKYLFTRWDWQDDDPPEQIAEKKAKIDRMMAQWWQLQEEIHKRGVLDLDPKITDNYGYDEERDAVVLLDFSHITDDKNRLRWDRTFGFDNLISFYKQTNKQLLWDRDSFNSISYGISKYEEGLRIFEPKKRIRYEDGEVKIEGWPSDEDLSKEELFIPLGDPFRIDAREMSDMVKCIEGILNASSGDSRFSPESRESILISVRRSMLWLYSRREREAMFGSANIPFFRKLYEKVLKRGREIDPDEYAVNVAPWWEELFFFALPMAASSFVSGIGSLWTVLVMAGVRAAFYYLHPSARAHAPPGEYINPLKVAVVGFMISLLPVLASMAFSGPSSVENGLVLSLITVLAVFSGIEHRSINKDAIEAGHAPAVRERTNEGEPVLSGLDLIKAKMNSLLPEVPVVEEEYTPVSHFKTFYREFLEALYGGQYYYAFFDVIIMLLQLRVPNAQWLYTRDGALEKIVIRTGGWSLGPVSAAAGIALILSGAVAEGVFLFFVSVTLVSSLCADIVLDILTAKASRSHEWLHAYQAKVAERARREGRIGNTRDFLSDNMMALEMIGKYNHKIVTEDMLDKVAAFVESRIDRMPSEETRVVFEDLDAEPLSREAREYFSEDWIAALQAHQTSKGRVKGDYVRFIKNLNTIFSGSDAARKEAFIKILSLVDLKGYLGSREGADEKEKEEAYKAMLSFVSFASGADGYDYCRKVLLNMKMLEDNGVVGKEDFRRIFRASATSFFSVFSSDKSPGRYLIFATLIEEGYLTYGEFIDQASMNFSRAGDLYDKLVEEGAVAPGGGPALSPAAVKFFESVGGKRAFAAAWNKGMIELLVAVSGGRDTAAYYVIPAFSWTKDPMRHAVSGLPALEEIAGKESMARLWAADPSQFMNILAYFSENFRDSKDVKGDFNRHFDRIKLVIGKEPAEFLREVWADLASMHRTVFDRPFGLEIEILQEQSRKYGMERPKVEEGDNSFDTMYLIEGALSKPDPEAQRLMIFLMMMDMNVKGETSAALHPNDPNVRMMEIIPPLFWDHEDGQRFIGYLRALGLVGARTPMDINIVLPDTTDMDALRRFQFVKHILYTPKERLRQFGDILKPDLRESIRTKEDFTSIREKDNSGGFSRFEDRMNSCNEGSLRYHQLMWEAFARKDSDGRLRSALEKYDAKIKGWFTEVLSGRPGSEGWAREWLIFAKGDVAPDDMPGDLGMKLASIDIGLPSNKERFLYFIGKLDDEEGSDLREIVRGTMDEIEGILRPVAKEAPSPELGPTFKTFLSGGGESTGERMKALAAGGPQKAEELRAKIKRGEKVNVLFVCLMNQQRSFLMQMVSDRLIREEDMPNISVSSRGLIDFSGYPHDRLKEACAKNGGDQQLLDNFRTTRMSEGDLAAADYVIMSDETVSGNLLTDFPKYADKLLYVSDLAPRMVAGLRALAGEFKGQEGRDMLDYTDVAGKLTAEQYYDLVYASLRRDLFGLPGTSENGKGEERGEPVTTDGSRSVKEEIGGILSGLGYSAESVGKMPEELVLLGSEIKKEFPDLKAQISARDIKAARRTLRDIALLLKAKGYKDIAEPNNVTRYLVNALGDEDIFRAIDDAIDVPADRAKRAANQLVTCTSIAQVMYIALKLLGVENVGVVYAPEHIMLSVGTAPGKIFFIDPTMTDFREVETDKYYNVLAGTDYMGIKPECLTNPHGDTIMLSRFYYYVRVTVSQALTASKYKNRGDAYAVIGKNDRAVEEYSKALEIDPGDPDTHNNLGNIYFAGGDYPGALEKYNIALKLNPVSGSVYLNRGNVFMKLGEPEKAADDYKIAMRCMETPDEGEEKLDEAFAAIRAKNALKDQEKGPRRTSDPAIMGDFTIEDPLPDDVPAIKELSKEIFGDYDAISVPSIIKAMEEASADGVPISYIKVCRTQGKVVGYILAKVNFAAELLEPGSQEMWLNIRQIAVHKDFSRQGIGSILSDRVMELARADGYNVFCMSAASEYSLKIAERMGFVRDELLGMHVLRSSRWGGAPAELPAADAVSLRVKQVMIRAKYMIPSLVNSLISVSIKNEKTVLAVDLGLGEGEVNAMIKELAEVLSSLEGNNDDLKRFFGSLVIIKGEGAALAARIGNLTDPEKGSVDPKNVIVITKDDNVELYGSVEGRGVIAGIEDGGFSKAAYMPLLEIMLFAVGKNLGWDEKTLKKHYAMIPNVTAAEKLSPEDIAALFGPDRKTLVIRLIPDAVEFNDKEFMEMIRGLKVMLARA